MRRRFSFLPKRIHMARYIYQCTKCDLTVEASRYPVGYCPRGGNHDWVKTMIP